MESFPVDLLFSLSTALRAAKARESLAKVWRNGAKRINYRVSRHGDKRRSNTLGEAVADPRYTQAFGGAPAAAQTAASAAVDPYARPLSMGVMLLGRYRIMGSCGTGGFGTVLACWDTRLQRRVAIKRMQLVSAAGAAPAAATLAEGLAEARASSTLTHPNIVTVFDFEADESFAYLVMEYVDGITLTELLNRVEGGTLTGDEVAYLVQAVAGALSFAHRSGVLHLDIKPSNIMIDREGAIKLCDFGMATLASAAGYGDARGGTVGYMPPEQILGELVDERADVFSLAVVAWQALAGENPFAALTAEESLALIQRGPKTKLSKIVPEAAGMAEEALLAALDPSPTSRMPSVEALANEVSFSLGDAAAGQQSVCHLLSQTVETEAQEPEKVAEALPISFRFPWIEDLIARITAAACAGVLANSILPAFLSDDSLRLVGIVVAAAGAAAWTPSASLIILGALTFSLLTVAGSASSILLAGVFGALATVWWVVVAPGERHASPALLLPIALQAPAASAAYAGAFLTPGEAFFTAGFGWATTRLVRACLYSGFVADDVLAILVDIAREPASWISLAGCAAGALVASLIARARPSASFSVLGQIVGVVIVATLQLVAARVENGGIWVAPTWESVGIAVVLGILASIAAVVCGPRFGEGEEVYA